MAAIGFLKIRNLVFIENIERINKGIQYKKQSQRQNNPHTQKNNKTKLIITKTIKIHPERGF